MNFDFIKPQAKVTITPRVEIEDKGKTHQLIITISHAGTGKTWDLSFRVYGNNGRIFGVVTTELVTSVGRSHIVFGGYIINCKATYVSRVSASAVEAYFKAVFTEDLINKCLDDVIKIILDGRDPSEESK